MKKLYVTITFALAVVLASAGGALAQVGIEVTFQEGDGNAYASTQDTYLGSGDDNWENTDVQTDNTGPISKQGLIRFENIFLSEGGLIPDGAVINSATLSLVVYDGGSDCGLYRTLLPWTEQSARDDFPDGGTGMSVVGTEIASVPDVAVFSPTAGQTLQLDVTTSLALWSLDPSSNGGWAMVAQGNSNWGFYSSENATLSNRPLLTIDYTAGVYIPAFSLADQTSSDAGTAYTTGLTVDVTLTGSSPDGAINGYMITETDTEPLPGDGGWLGAAPATFAITDPGAGNVATLYAWVKDVTDAIAGASASIRYLPGAAPASAASVDAVSVDTAVATWSTPVRRLRQAEIPREGQRRCVHDNRLGNHPRPGTQRRVRRCQRHGIRGDCPEQRYRNGAQRLSPLRWI